MVIPPYLQPGDKIAIVAPARKISAEELEPALQLLKNNGFEPILGRYVYSTNNQFAGTDAERLADMQWALDDPEIKAVLAARGGYGCMRIVDAVDLTQFKKYPKWIIGYSDLTVFHAHILKHTGISTLHATMPINFFKNVEATNSLFNALKGDPINYAFNGTTYNFKTPVNGIVTGGNLSLLYALCGTSSAPDTSNTILYIEDLDEYLYHIDRMFLSLKRAGFLSHLKALLVGSFTDIKDNAVAYGKTYEEIIREHTQEFGYPVIFNFPAGHQELNLALKLGYPTELNLAQNNCLFTQKA